MSYSNNGSKQYLKNAVMTATPEQLHLMLYDGAIRFTTQGQQAIRDKDREASFNNFDRAQRIVLELNNGLRPEINPELANQMATLYNYVYRRLIDANVNQDLEAADDALRILRHQRETWVMVMEKVAKEQHGGAPAPAPAKTADDIPKRDKPASAQPVKPQAKSPLYVADSESTFNAEA